MRLIRDRKKGGVGGPPGMEMGEERDYNIPISIHCHHQNGGGGKREIIYIYI